MAAASPPPSLLDLPADVQVLIALCVVADGGRMAGGGVRERGDLFFCSYPRFISRLFGADLAALAATCSKMAAVVRSDPHYSQRFRLCFDEPVRGLVWFVYLFIFLHLSSSLQCI